MGAVGRRRSAAASWLVVVLTASLLGWFAVRSEGAVVHQADLWDGGIWVTNSADATFGRVNKAIGQLDAGVAIDVASGTPLDVLQDGASVVGVSPSTGEMHAIDAQTARLGPVAATIPGAARSTGLEYYVPLAADLHGGTVAVVDAASGRVWAQRLPAGQAVGDLAGLGGKPLATVGAGAAVTVDVRGNVHAVSGSTGKVVTIPVAGAGFGKPVMTTISVNAKAVDITAVGTRWVVYDPTKDAVWYQGGAKPVAGGIQQAADQGVYAALQQPGPDSSSVALEGADAVHVVSLGDGSAGNGGVKIPDEQTTGGPVSGNAQGLRVARPVVLGGCVYGAWAAPGKAYYNVNCGKADPVPAASVADPQATNVRQGVAFRVNRGLLVLNDQDNGNVWDLQAKVVKIDNWDALTPPVSKDDKDKKNQNLLNTTTRAQPPRAQPDAMNVRPGRTSVLHVLDNDTDPSGGILAIAPADVTDPHVPGVSAVVSGDGQAVDLTVPAQVDRTSFSFHYKANNGTLSARALVTVHVVPDTVNGPPVLRFGAARLARTVYPVLPGNTVTIQGVGDWRDPENDPVSLVATSAATSVDGAGRLLFTAPSRAGSLSVAYSVADDRGLAAPASAQVDVLDPVKSQPVKPVTQPDSVRGVVGKPIQIQPLDNDIPGADPTDPESTMTLSAALASSGALKVDTDLATGTVTVVATTARSYQLSYGAQIGTVATPGRIRIDVTPPVSDALPPVAVPDSGTVRDQAPALVDVLANDSSPRSDVLVTQSVVAAPDSSWLQASIFQGRWVRVQANQPAPLDATTPRRGQLIYTVSDGTKSATSTIEVVQQPPDDRDLPMVTDDTAVVRVGDVVTVPVLDNDTMAGGIPLRIDPNSVRVVDGGTKQNAFVSGNAIRYVPEDSPATLRVAKQVTLEYAAYPEGMPEKARTGRVTVTVKPLPTAANPDQAPVAASFSSAVTAGQPITLTVPTSGVDPDGDLVSVHGIVGSDEGGVELHLGRVVSIGPNTIRYECYPNASGTEIINYRIADRFGATSQGFIRVGVVAPADPQPPIAVEDSVSAAPGRRVTVPFTANDLISPGDPITVDVDGLNPAATLARWTVDRTAFTATTRAPESAAQVTQLQYGIDDGLFDPSRTSVLVRGVKGARNPPTAVDDVAKPAPGATTALVDVLANDTDIDSDPGRLTVTRVLSGSARVEGDKVRVDVLDHAYTVPYVITDQDGLTAMALVYVPTGGKGNPFVVSSALISMDKDSTKDVQLGDYITSPRGRAISITAVSTVSTSPSQNLGFQVTGPGSVRLTSSGGYVGPGAIMLQVTDKPRDQEQSATAEGKDYGTAYVSVPVQIGPKVALLRCPSVGVRLTAGGLPRSLDIPSLCHAWVPVGMDLGSVRYATSWSGAKPQGVDLATSGPGDRLVTLRAGSSAPSSNAALTVKVAGSGQTQQLKVTVLGTPGGSVAKNPLPVTPPATVRPISILGLTEGGSQSVDVSAYLQSPLAHPVCRIVRATVEAGKGLSATANGCTLTVSAGANPSPTGSIALLVTDQPGSTRQASGRATVSILANPGTPGGLSAVADRVAGGQARVSYTPPAYDGGSPIQYYLVRWSGGPSSGLHCISSPCTVTGLKNGRPYTFQVWAVNAVGQSNTPAGPSDPVIPDTKPDQITSVTVTSRGDQTLSISWVPPRDDGSPITAYEVSVVDAQGKGRGTQTVPGGVTSFRATGLDNNQPQKIRVLAVNGAGRGPWSAEVQDQSAGKPAPITSLTVTPSTPTPNTSSSTVSIRWSPSSNVNGPPVKSYTVNRRVAGGAWSAITTAGAGQGSTTDHVPYDGRRYEWMVTVTNGGDVTSDPGNVAGFSANGIPANFSVSAVEAGPNFTVNVTVRLGASNSSGYSSVRWSGSGASGNAPCGSSCSGTIVFTTSALNIGAQQISVTATNNGGQSNSAQSGTVRPYGPTLTPANLSATVNDRTVTWTWTNRDNGRTISQDQSTGQVARSGSVFESVSASGGYRQQMCLQVRAEAADSGWSGYTGQVCATTAAPPPPTTWSETSRGGTALWTNYSNASGSSARLAAGQTVEVSCKALDSGTMSSTQPDGYWYRVASGPYAGYYGVANTFTSFSGGRSDPRVPIC